METDIFPAFEEYLQPARFKIAYGGRGSAKTRQFTSIITNNVMCYGWRVVCLREIMKSIQDSVYQEFVDEIERRNLGQYFEILQTEIRSTSGGIIRFDGLFRNQQRIKGYAGFDAAWVEEAAAVTGDSWKFLIPTLRKSGSEIWVSFNPESPLDDTYRRFVTERVYPDWKDGQRYCISKKINYTDNPRFPPELRDDMEIMKEEDYDLYLHVYEGEPVANSDLAVIKPAWIAAAVDVHKELGIEPSGSKRLGFDVADEGPDANATVSAFGQVIMDAKEWKDNDPNSAAVTAWDHALEFGAEKIIYDSIGVGAGAKGELRQCVSRRWELQSLPSPEIIGFNAAGAVVDPDSEYQEGKRNRDMFTNAKAQAWWALRDGLYQAWKARNGKDYDIDKVISISSDIGDKALNKLKSELAQPRREYLSGKIRIEPKDKMARRGVKSPNLADAAVMAFAPEDNGGGAAIFKRRR